MFWGQMHIKMTEDLKLKLLPSIYSNILYYCFGFIVTEEMQKQYLEWHFCNPNKNKEMQGLNFNILGLVCYIIDELLIMQIIL